MRIRRFALALIVALPVAAGIQAPIAVDGGLISGIPGWGWGVHEYLGIPFAAPPVDQPVVTVGLTPPAQAPHFRRPLIPINSAACHHLILPDVARNSTSCNFIARSVAALG